MPENRYFDAAGNPHLSTFAKMEQSIVAIATEMERLEKVVEDDHGEALNLMMRRMKTLEDNVQEARKANGKRKMAPERSKNAKKIREKLGVEPDSVQPPA